MEQSELRSNNEFPTGTVKPPLRILIADDHELIRSAIACLLERCGYEVVGQAADGKQAVALWNDLRPDLTLLDLRMPGMDGIAALEAIRAIDGGAHLVLLSTFDCDAPVSRALRAGAGGYLLKGCSPELLCRCLQVVHEGGRFLAPELAERMVTAENDPKPTAREIEVLGGVVQGLCNKRIARALSIEEGTVKAHLKSILRKLEACSRTEAASIAIRRGLVQV